MAPSQPPLRSNGGSQPRRIRAGPSSYSLAELKGKLCLLQLKLPIGAEERRQAAGAHGESHPPPREAGSAGRRCLLGAQAAHLKLGKQIGRAHV